MAYRILINLTGPHDDFNLDVTFAELYPSFISRTRARYGPDVDAVGMDFKSSDPWVFDFWGRTKLDGVAVDPEDRRIQYEFWRRHIGNSRLRLARAFRSFLLPLAVYRVDAALAVENKIPIADLKRFYDQFPDDATLTDADKRSLNTLKRLLNGEFKNGMGPDGLYDS